MYPLLQLAVIAAPVVMGYMQENKMNTAASNLEGDLTTARNNVNDLKLARQDILNQAEDIRNLKNELYNPYENIGIATKAAELQVAETDKALANTLDAMMATGRGAGGATALAQMASASKQNVSASIEKQEIDNAKLKASGEAKLAQQRIGLEQSALAAEQAAWGLQEQRDRDDLDRAYSDMDFLRNQQQAYLDAGAAAVSAGWQQGATTGAALWGSAGENPFSGWGDINS